jgi:hypothetical protein
MSASTIIKLRSRKLLFSKGASAGTDKPKIRECIIALLFRNRFLYKTLYFVVSSCVLHQRLIIVSQYYKHDNFIYFMLHIYDNIYFFGTQRKKKHQKINNNNTHQLKCPMNNFMILFNIRISRTNIIRIFDNNLF